MIIIDFIAVSAKIKILYTYFNAALAILLILQATDICYIYWKLVGIADKSNTLKVIVALMVATLIFSVMNFIFIYASEHDALQILMCCMIALCHPVTCRLFHDTMWDKVPCFNVIYGSGGWVAFIQSVTATLAKLRSLVNSTVTTPHPNPGGDNANPNPSGIAMINLPTTSTNPITNPASILSNPTVNPPSVAPNLSHQSVPSFSITDDQTNNPPLTLQPVASTSVDFNLDNPSELQPATMLQAIEEEKGGQEEKKSENVGVAGADTPEEELKEGNIQDIGDIGDDRDTSDDDKSLSEEDRPKPKDSGVVIVASKEETTDT